MLDQIAQNLIILPVLGFVLAAGAGVLIRSRRAREDKRVRDGLQLLAKVRIR
jgi:LPXTG-motif cell wall-anchored protein